MALPIEMRVIEIAEPGGPEVLRPATRPVPRADGRRDPDPGAGGRGEPAGRAAAGRQLRAAAGGVRPAGARGGRRGGGGRAGRLAPWQVGDAVCALLPGGGYAEYALTHQDHALPVPDGHGDDGGGRALRDVLHGLGQRVRARAAGGGRDAAGARRRRRGSARRRSSWRRRAAPGCSRPRGRRRSAGPASTSGRSWRSTTATADFVAAVREATAGRGVDVILDMVGGDYLARDVRALAPDGRLVMIAHQAGADGRAQLRPGDDEAADDHRLDAAAAVGRGQGADRRRRCGARSGRCSTPGGSRR